MKDPYLLIDIETRSRVDLKTEGVYRYAKHGSTEVMLFGYCTHDRLPQVVDLHKGERIPDDILRMMSDPGVPLVAWNAAFERLVLGHNIQLKRLYPGIEKVLDPARWWCASHQARAAGFPAALGLASKFAGGAEQKDLDGHRLMLRICKPQREGNYWEPDPDSWEKYKAYCRTDVSVEDAFWNGLPPLTEAEHDAYVLNEIMNDRGVVVDTTLIDRVIHEHTNETGEALRRFRELTGLDSWMQVEELRRWINRQLGHTGLYVATIRKDELEPLLSDPLVPDYVADVIELRLTYGKAATKKFIAAFNRSLPTVVGHTVHVRTVNGLMMTHAAVTGRASSVGVQIHNLRRDAATPSEIDAWLRGEGDRPELGKMVRGMFIPRPGNRFVISDYSAIEARGVAWLAGEKRLLKAFAHGEDVYCTAWADMFGEEINKHDHPDKRFLAKGLVLGAGYAGSVGAMRRTMGRQIDHMKDVELMSLVRRYRRTYSAIPRMWTRLIYALRKAVNTGEDQIYEIPGTRQTVRFEFYDESSMLRIVLPSGRAMTYQGVYIDPWAGEVTYARANRRPKKGETEWPRAELSVPSLTENIVQGLAHDILRAAQAAAEQHPFFTPVFHVHDELVSEVAKETITLHGEDEVITEYEQHVMLAPSNLEWMEGFPLAVETNIETRYTK